MKKLSSYSYLLALFIFVFFSLIAGPLSNIVSAVTVTPGGGNSLQATLSWVNECDISGTIVDIVAGISSTTNFNLSDNTQGCIQDYIQNGKHVNVQYIDDSSCQSSNIDADPSTPGALLASGDLYYQAPGGGGACEDFSLSSNNLTPAQTGNADIVYALSGTTITRLDGNTDPSYTFTQSTTNKKLYVANDGTNGCNDTIVVNSASNATLWELSQPTGNPNAAAPSSQKAPNGIGADGCFVSYYDDDINGPTAQGAATTEKCSLNQTYNSASYCSEHPQSGNGSFNLHLGTTANLTPTSGGSGAATGNNQPSCESTGGPLSWLTCAIINGVGTLESKIEGLLENVLTTPPIDLNSADCKSGTTQSGDQSYTACIYNVWSEFRIYANIILVVILLIIVIAEAAGGGTLGAYTIRKVLPRILIAAVLINISIYIMAALVDVTNILGQGIFNLLTIPFKASGTYHINITAGAGNFIGGTTAVGGSLVAILIGGAAFHHTLWSSIAGGGAGDAIGFFALFVLLPAVIAIIGVLLTIFFRTVLIVLLLMTAPIAFALYCMPNTEKVFRRWWDTLFKTLMVFPIVMVVFALCNIGSVVVSSFTYGSEQWAGELLAILGVTAPLFLVPFAFKISGGVIGNLQGAISNFGNKAKEGILGNPNDPNSLRNSTRHRFAVRREAAGLSWRGIGTRINPRQITPSGRDVARDRLSAQRQGGLEQLRRQSEDRGIWRAMQNDSSVMAMLADYKSGGDARVATSAWYEKERARATTDAARLDVDRLYNQKTAAIAAAEKIGYNPVTRRSAILNPNYIGYEVAQGEEGWNHSLAMMDEISAGDQFQFRSMQDEYQATAKSAAGRIDQAANTNGARAYNGNRAWNSQDLSTIGRGKPSALKGATDYFIGKDSDDGTHVDGVLDRIANGKLDAGKDADFIREADVRRKNGEAVTNEQVAAEALGAFYSEMDTLSRYASGANRDAAVATQRRAGQAINDKASTGTGLSSVLAKMYEDEGGRGLPATDAITTLKNLGSVRGKARSFEDPRISGLRDPGGSGGGGGGAGSGGP